MRLPDIRADQDMIVFMARMGLAERQEIVWTIRMMSAVWTEIQEIAVVGWDIASRCAPLPAEM
jgi:hypothetical protein